MLFEGQFIAPPDEHDDDPLQFTEAAPHSYIVTNTSVIATAMYSCSVVIIIIHRLA